MARRLGNESQGRTWAGDSLEFGERFFMKEAKERASGACQERLGAEAHRSQVSWTARTDGCHDWYHYRRICFVEGLGVDCPNQNVGIRQVGKISKECRVTCDQQVSRKPEVDVEVQPGAAEAERRERRWQRPRERSGPVRPRDETHQGGVREKRVRFDEPSSATASASDAAEDDGIQSRRTRGKDTRGREVYVTKKDVGRFGADSTMSSTVRTQRKEFQDDMLTTTSVAIESESC